MRQPGPAAGAPSAEALPAADFFDFEALLSGTEQAKLAELRGFLAREVAPFATDWWNKAEFPAHILPKLAALELSAPAQRGYSHLFAGLVIAEMTRVDTSRSRPTSWLTNTVVRLLAVSVRSRSIVEPPGNMYSIDGGMTI